MLPRYSVPQQADQGEIVYRLLRGQQGVLRAIATLGDQSHRTAKAIAWLRHKYRKGLRLEELAELRARACKPSIITSE